MWIELGTGREKTGGGGKENRYRGAYERLDEAGNVRGEMEHSVSFKSRDEEFNINR